VILMSEGGKVMSREFLAERDARIFKMRQAGMSAADISKRFGVTVSVVQKAIQRQLEKLNRETLMAYPEVLRLELERLDALQSALWPMTQHRKIKTDDGTEVQVEPDMKAIQTVLSIMKQRSQLLGMEQNNLNIQMDVTQRDVIKSTIVGESEAKPLNSFDPEAEARGLLEVMARSGVISQDMINQLLGENIVTQPIEVFALESAQEADDNE
jgi:hypothetical protein